MAARFLFSLAVLFIFSSADAQCDPDPLYQDSLFGVWPDTITDFPPAIIGEEYFGQIDIMIPASSGDVPQIDLPFDLPIDSGLVNSVVGLPPGLTYECNSQTPAPCSYLPQSLGCAAIVGTPTEEGVYPLQINVTAYTFFIVLLEAPVTFEGYEVVVSDGITSIRERDLFQVDGLKNIPNPFSGSTTIQFITRSSMPLRFTVMDLLGQVVWNESIVSSPGQNDIVFTPSGLKTGLYLYSLTSPEGTVTQRMIFTGQ